MTSPGPAAPGGPPGLEGAAATAAVVAVKRVDHAKSRLRPLPDALRRRLAWTMAVDTLRALSAAVDRVVVVSDEPGLADRLAADGVTADVLAEPAVPGMNTALTHGARAVQAAGAVVVVAAVADLPALRPDSVRRVLAAGEPHPRSFLADAGGTGTTLLVARGVGLDPQFQGRSAAAHRVSGAVALDLHVPDARRDVDTEVDLADAVGLGVGAATAALLDRDGRLGRYGLVTVAGERRHAVLEGDRVLSSWS